MPLFRIFLPREPVNPPHATQNRPGKQPQNWPQNPRSQPTTSPPKKIPPQEPSGERPKDSSPGGDLLWGCWFSVFGLRESLVWGTKLHLEANAHQKELGNTHTRRNEGENEGGYHEIFSLGRKPPRKSSRNHAMIIDRMSAKPLALMRQRSPEQPIFLY